MTSSDYKITFSCANCCKHSSGISHDPSLISCSIAELKHWQDKHRQQQEPGASL